MDLVGIVLAAGSSRRMGTPKALLPFLGASFLTVILARMREAGVSSFIVVAGHHKDAIAKGIDLSGAELVHNADPDRGQLSSLQEAALRLRARGECPAALVALVDHPAVATGTYRALIAAWEAAGRRGVLLSRFRGKRGHPLLIGAREFACALALPPTAQMREAVHWPGNTLIDVDSDDPGIVQDVDTPGDYQRLTAPLSVLGRDEGPRSAKGRSSRRTSPRTQRPRGGFPS